MRKIILHIFILLFAFNVFLLASSVPVVTNNGNQNSSSVQVSEAETVEVPLDLFGTVGMVLVIGLTSLLGMFFMKNEFSES